MAIYAQTSGTNQTKSGSFVPIPGLSITIPESVGVTALVILNVPNPYAKGNGLSGRDVRHFGERNRISGGGSLTYNEQVPPSTGRIPTTLVVGRASGPRQAGHPGDVVGGARQYGDHRYPGQPQRGPLANATSTRRT